MDQRATNKGSRPMHSASTRPAKARPLFAPLPEDGPWTALSLTRGQFFGILAASCLVFLFWDGPLWAHLGGHDLGRLVSSYALIPLATAAALYRNQRLSLGSCLSASAVIAVLKLLLTAGLDLALGIALGVR